MGISRHLFFSCEPESQGSIVQSYGVVRGFRISKLPDLLRSKIQGARRSLSDSKAIRLVRTVQQRRRRVALRAAAGQRLAPGREASAVRVAMNVYFREIDNGKAEQSANLVARRFWLEAFGTACHERTIRRLAARVDSFGGPELAPLDAFAAGKSISRARGAVKGGTHGAAATAAARRHSQGPMT
jgi:hypothetical protein